MEISCAFTRFQPICDVIINRVCIDTREVETVCQEIAETLQTFMKSWLPNFDRIILMMLSQAEPCFFSR